ncbi:hypothetical protein Lepto7375DRAFT_5432 [Leptolyngbya sp. PCC 7375]|nr:hypothetical protein Lepto7375DRAFT_5432 [Leptolyngbya sp. PCC 7375]
MKSWRASNRLSSGIVAAGLALAMPMHAMAAVSLPQLETDSPQSHTTITEWHWRDMVL